MAHQQVHLSKERSMILVDGYMRHLDVTSKGVVLNKIVFEYFYVLNYFHSDRVDVDIETNIIKSKGSAHDCCFVGDWLDTESIHSFHFRINKAERYIGIGLSPKAGKDNLTPDVCVCTDHVYAMYTNGSAWKESKEIIKNEQMLTFKDGNEGTVHYDPIKSTVWITKKDAEAKYILFENVIKTKYKWGVSVCFDADDSLTVVQCS